MLLTTLLALLAAVLPAAGVKVLFDPQSPSTGPYPTDALTVADPDQKTGVRINLPLPNCEQEASTCNELAYINTLDGFSLEPRLRIRFSGPINPETLRGNVFVAWLGDEMGRAASINAVMYDPASNTAYGEPDVLLPESRHYALLVTTGVRDAAGDPVEPDPAFLACAQGRDGYCGKLAAALAGAPQWIAGASVFTTMSATAWLQKARTAIQDAPLGYQRLNMFQIANISSFVYRGQTAVTPPAFTDLRLTPVPGDPVGRIAFVSYVSPRFVGVRGIIPPTPTGPPVTLPDATSEIVFCAWLPKAPAPAGGYPVVIVGPGANSWYPRNSSFIAAALAERGFATLSFNYAGQGYGPDSTVMITDTAGTVTQVKAGGRGGDGNGDGKIDTNDTISPPEQAAVRIADSLRQTALDMMQLVRVLKAGVDLDGDGGIDLNGNRVSFVGHSFGAMVGPMLHALEPSIRASVLSDGAGTLMDQARWTKSATFSLILSAHRPSLLNAGTSFEAEYALRDQPVKIIAAPGAIAFQEFFERVEWMSMPGDALSYAPLLKGVTRPVLFHMEFGDRTAPNNVASNLIRTAGGRASTSFYRHDLARAVAPTLPADPHMIFYYVPGTPELRAVWQAGQAQIAEFLATDGARIIFPNDMVRSLYRVDLFGMPERLPEELNW